MEHSHLLPSVPVARHPDRDPPRGRPAAPPDHAKVAAKVLEVIRHMGSCADQSGNTLVGIRRAIDAGAHTAEVDVRTTKDGILICLHDTEVNCTTDGTGKVADLTLAEVKTLDAGSRFDPKFKGERVPTLREVLESLERQDPSHDRPEGGGLEC